MKEKPKPGPNGSEQTIEELQQRYQLLNTKKIQSETNLLNATQLLDNLKKEAREKYGTDDLDALREKLGDEGRERREAKELPGRSRSHRVRTEVGRREVCVVRNHGSGTRRQNVMHSIESSDPEVPAATEACRDLRPPTEARRHQPIGSPTSATIGLPSRGRLAGRFDQLNAYLAVADKVTVALEQLNQELFQQLLGIVQEKLTVALQEILEQPIQFRAQADFKRGATTVEFWIDRDGNREDVLRGQGGSVANILSVGLRMFALTTLDEQQHRRFLVLDEQDCWLRPDLVPRLVKIVHEAGAALGFQVLMISHHEVALFERYADRIYQFSLDAAGEIQVRPLVGSPSDPDRTN